MHYIMLFLFSLPTMKFTINFYDFSKSFPVICEQRIIKTLFWLTNSVMNHSDWFVSHSDWFIKKNQNIDLVTYWTSLCLFYSIRAYSGLCVYLSITRIICIRYRNVHYFQARNLLFISFAFLHIFTPKCISFQRTDRYIVMRNYNTKTS